MSWATGVARVLHDNGPTIIVSCPHCKGRHKHGRGMAGSRNVAAGCHAGHSRCRSYAIPAIPKPADA